MTPIADQNNDGIDDFHLTYPSGNRQILYYYGIIDEPPGDCRILEVPSVDPTVISIPAFVTQFLYTGTNPIQTGVATDTINLEHAATVRGKVTTVDGEPLPNVIVSIKDYPEYGQTVTTCNGYFNLAVNGGATLTVNYQLDGYLPVQRQIKPNWQEYAVIDDIAMTALDPQVSVIDLTANTPIQVAQGSPVTDLDGTRQAVVLFPQGLTATMTLPDGSTQPLTQLDVRATEYTVGEQGPAAMPAPLPPHSGYTYAVELSVDQALAVGATRVDFSQPVPLYVDNFLNFPVGGVVPIGWYDRSKAAWEPSNDGRVIKIIDIENGLATLDVNGYGDAASSWTLSELGITDAERQQLATLYAPGQSFWRSPISHFTPWDCNWPYGPPNDAERPSPDEPKNPDEDNPEEPCEQEGCIIEAENQVLGESLAITGTPFTLNYRSNRVPGYKTPYMLEIPLRGHSVPSSLKQIIVNVRIAGQHLTYDFPPTTRRMTFIWDGKDAHGRRMQGSHSAKVQIGYSYKMVYQNPGDDFAQSFAQIGQGPISAERGRTDIILWQNPTYHWLGTWYPHGTGLGSLTFNVHHHYNPLPKILYQGNGSETGTNSRRFQSHNMSNMVVSTIAGNGESDLHCQTGPATQISLSPRDLTFGPDGHLYIANFERHCVLRLENDQVTLVAGTGTSGLSGDGQLATQAQLNEPSWLAFHPDGSLYIADTLNHRIRRVDRDGMMTTIAGNRDLPSYDEESNSQLASGYPLYFPKGITFGPDNQLYFANWYKPRITWKHKIYRVTANDHLQTVTGLGTYGFAGDGELATSRKVRIKEPTKVAFGPDGSLYFSDTYNNRVRKIGLDGIITTVAGGGSGWGFKGDGGPATQATLNGPTGIAFGPDGNLYIADTKNNRIRRVDLEGTIYTVVGNGEYGFNGDGHLATEINLSHPTGITFSPDGYLYIADASNYRVLRLAPFFPGLSLQKIYISSESGSSLYEFTPEGHHLRTIDSITGQTIYTFAYTENGYLREIRDLDGDITRIERNGDTPVAIVAPDGQRTTLQLDENGYLASMTNPAGETHQLHYNKDGLLEEFINPRGHKSIYRYNDLGRFEEDTNAAGGGWMLARTEHADSGYTTTMTSKEGRVTRYQVKPQDNGELLRINTKPDGTKTQTLVKTNGETVMTSPDGTTIVSKQGPDPRFGMQAPFTEKMTVTTPKGLISEVTTEKMVELLDDNDPLSLTKLTTKVTINGRISTGIYDAAQKKSTSISAEGRQIVSHFDAKGRVIKEEVPGLANVYYVHDERGRLISTTIGEGEEARTATISYDPDSGYVAKITDALDRSATFTRDKVGRILSKKLPNDRQINYRFDANGNVTSITPPSKPVHQFDYTPVDLQQQYTPPTVTGISAPQTHYAYNLDKQLLQIRRPDGQTIDLVYDEVKGRLDRIDLPNEESINYTYFENTGKLKTITAPDGGILSYTYDGSLVLSETWKNGSVVGTLTLDYDNHFQVISVDINGNTVNYQYDADNLLIKAGDLSLTRNAQNGLLTATQLGHLTTERTHNIFGEMIGETARYETDTLYYTEYSRDKLGRITQRMETIEGITTTIDYRYDLAGRLIEVKQNDVVTEAYTYDSNGNRLIAETENGVLNGSYDEQDRVIQYGNNTYDYTANGELLSKNNNGEITQYRYDVLGNLRSVQLPNGKQIEYLIDARNRRIGKKINGQLVQGFLYQDSLNPVVELDNNGNIISKFVYGSKANIPDYMLKNGKTYRILSDHLGSPRLVIDISNGSIAQKIDYDAFGNVIFDSNPGFQPFGFAGGIYDLDTKLTRFGARDYDAQTGRWTAKDPILFAGGDANLYGYVLGDPVNFLDPQGKLFSTGFFVALAVGTPVVMIISSIAKSYWAVYHDKSAYAATPIPGIPWTIYGPDYYALTPIGQYAIRYHEELHQGGLWSETIAHRRTASELKRLLAEGCYGEEQTKELERLLADAEFAEKYYYESKEFLWLWLWE